MQPAAAVWMLTVLYCTIGSSLSSSQDKLYEASLGKKSGYIKQLIPTEKANDKLTVQFGVALPEVIDLEEKTGQFQARVWLKMTWHDYRLAWNPSEFKGVEVLNVPAKNLWLPDITLYNGYKQDLDLDQNAVVYSSGKILWVAPLLFFSTCIHEFRTDSWTCDLKFGSWSFDSSKLDITPFEGKVDLDMSDYISNFRWSLLEHKGERKEKKYECCSESYPSMEYSLKFRSKIGPSFMGRRKRAALDTEF